MSLASVCASARNNGISIWLLGHKEMTQVILQPKGTPRFNANHTYCIVSQSVDKTVLQDKSSNIYKVYFWIGAHSEDYDTNFEQAVRQVTELKTAVTGGAHIRLYIEFQYAESSHFFTLFKR